MPFLWSQQYRRPWTLWFGTALTRTQLGHIVGRRHLQEQLGQAKERGMQGTMDVLCSGMLSGCVSSMRDKRE